MILNFPGPNATANRGSKLVPSGANKKQKGRKGIVHYFFPIDVPPSNKEVCSYMDDLGAAAEKE